MSSFGSSQASQTLELNANTNDVAKACLDVLNKLGEVTEASPATGVIHGMIKRGFINYETNIKIQIYKRSDTQTTLWIMADRNMSSGSIYEKADYDMDKFSRTLVEHPNLKGKTATIWDMQEVSKPGPGEKQGDVSAPAPNKPVELTPKQRNKLIFLIAGGVLVVGCLCLCLFFVQNGDYLWCLFTGC